MEAEKYEGPVTSVDWGARAVEVKNSCREGHGARGRDVVTDIEPGLYPVNGDRAQLSQLLHNLVSNSAKYARPETPITIRLDGSGTMIKLSVTDESEGIEPRHLPRLTERFYRVASGRSRSLGGTGLGLALVNPIVEQTPRLIKITKKPGKH